MRTSTPTSELDRLLDMAIADDVGAWAAFIDATSPTALRLALLATESRLDAEQLTFEAYCRAWHERGGFLASELSPLSWLLSILMTAARDTPD